jgi:rhamnosyl/mannosyltransferase
MRTARPGLRHAGTDAVRARAGATGSEAWISATVRVLHVGKYYPPVAGGIENFLADLLPALQRRGVQGAALVHAPSRSDRRRLAAADAEAGAAPIAKPPPIYQAPTHGRLLYAPLSPGFPRMLARAIRAFAPQLLHLHLPNTSAFSALLLPAARRLPWVIHWHADVVASTLDRRMTPAYQLYRPFEQRLLSASRAVIATSPPYLEHSQALSRWHARCCAIPLGIDPARLPEPQPGERRSADARWGEPSLRVLAIGRLTYYKGHEHLIDAAAQVPGARVLIAGAGERRNRLQQRIARLGLGERVSLLGFVGDRELRALLARCDVLCLPSVERTEAFGLVLLEAMRFAKPVVVSDIPGSGCGWLVRRAGHGLLTPPGQPDALARALRTLQHDPAQRRTLGAAGHAALGETFGIHAVAAKVHGLYRELLEQNAGPEIP